jgi:hypothetical protein
MSRFIYILAFFPLAIVANAQIVDMRHIDEFNAKLAEKRQANEIPDSKIDEKKLNAAHERHDKRREEALEVRRRRNANKSHFYTLTKTLPVPFYSRPFQSQKVPIPRGISSRSRAAQLVSRVSPPVMAARQTQRPPRVLFLMGEGRSPSDPKPSALRDNRFLVIAPELPKNDFAGAVRVAELALNQYRPDIIVGDSRGGAVALNMNSGDTPLVLLSPAWKKWGAANTVKPGSVILHSPSDQVIPFGDSELLVANSELSNSTIVRTGVDHRLIDNASLQVLLLACLRQMQ